MGDIRKERREAVEIGARLRRAREAQDIYQEQLAEAVGINRSLLSKLENGQRAPSVFLAMALIEALQISPQYLLWGSMQGVDGELAAKLARSAMTDKRLPVPRVSISGRTRAAHPTHRRRAS